MKNRLFLSVMIGLLIVSCKKENTTLTPQEPAPTARYIELHSAEVKYQYPPVTLDLDGDGRRDLRFGVQLVGDALNQTDKLQFVTSSGINTALAVDSNNESPTLVWGDTIPTGNIANCEWYVVSQIVLMQKHTHVSGSITWLGNWLGATRKYLAFQQEQDGGVLTGWVELTADKEGQRLVLHRACISKEINRHIKTGI
jgi:hypothetical protein